MGFEIHYCSLWACALLPLWVSSLASTFFHTDSELGRVWPNSRLGFGGCAKIWASSAELNYFLALKCSFSKVEYHTQSFEWGFQKMLPSSSVKTSCHNLHYLHPSRCVLFWCLIFYAIIIWIHLFWPFCPHLTRIKRCMLPFMAFVFAIEGYIFSPEVRETSMLTSMTFFSLATTLFPLVSSRDGHCG